MPPTKETKTVKAKGKAAAKTEAKTKKAVAKATKGKHFGRICADFSHTLSELLHSVTLTVRLSLSGSCVVHTLFSHSQWCLTETVSFTLACPLLRASHYSLNSAAIAGLKSRFAVVCRLPPNFSHLNSL